MKLCSLYVLIIWVVFFSSCKKEDLEVMGMTPIYMAYDDFSEIQTLSPKPFKDLGKLVISGSFIFINEINKGIHVIDNTNPANPTAHFFWNIPGNKEFTLSENTLYADNGLHLLVIDISVPSQIKIVKYLANQYILQATDAFPENHDGWFECYDSHKGILVGWEMKNLINPNCKIL